MSNHHFITVGAVPPGSSAYVLRKADEQILHRLRNLEYVQVSEPKYHGKTSLIYHVRERLMGEKILLLYVYLDGLASHNDGPGWYKALAEHLANQVSTRFPTLPLPGGTDVHDVHSWKGFLKSTWEILSNIETGIDSDSRELDELPEPGVRGIVIALDGIERIPISASEEFFRNLRVMFNERFITPEYQKISFALLGEFDPVDLIKNGESSPFEVAESIELEDLDFDGVSSLVNLLELPGCDANQISERVYYWTDGHPYLTQRICSFLESVKRPISSHAIDDAVERLLSKDGSLHHVKKVISPMDTLSYLKEVSIANPPYDIYIKEQFRLAHIVGIIKVSTSSYRCTIRNRIYEQLLSIIERRNSEVAWDQSALNGLDLLESQLPPTPVIQSKHFHEIGDQFIDAVLLTAVRTELNAVLRLLQPLPSEPNVWSVVRDGRTYYLGYYGTHRVVVTMCAMGYAGPGGATQTTAKAIRAWNPKAVIMAGIAFGIDPLKQRLGDVIVSARVADYGNQAVRSDGTVHPRGSIVDCCQKLLDRFRNAHWVYRHYDGSPGKFDEGLLLSGPILLDNADLKAQLISHYPSASAGDMEAIGVYSAATDLHTPWIVIKSICDWGDGKKSDNYQVAAAAAAASLTHCVLMSNNALDDFERPNLHH